MTEGDGNPGKSPGGGNTGLIATLITAFTGIVIAMIGAKVWPFTGSPAPTEAVASDVASEEDAALYDDAAAVDDSGLVAGGIWVVNNCTSNVKLALSYDAGEDWATTSDKYLTFYPGEETYVMDAGVQVVPVTGDVLYWAEADEGKWEGDIADGGLNKLAQTLPKDGDGNYLLTFCDE